MGRSQILADITDFKLNPKAAHKVGKTRLVDSTVQTRGIWESDDVIGGVLSEAADDLTYFQEKLVTALAVPEEFLVKDEEPVQEVSVLPETPAEVSINDVLVEEVVVEAVQPPAPEEVQEELTESVESSDEKKIKTSKKKKKVDKET